ncbi:diguanylate cyclase [Aliikangiella marina]|uniref:Diguanylate cyclase n=1 Tax=Aliikangiella marina TaxID=1712262 RepID=A0A545TJC9_9GAMM|nr:DEAD/DEAH box helicase family protein [Aliikangiella marina]TQV77325.1 diguanylate cyclase [Aliikangiella marina]
MKLRHWQSECATRALHHYHTKNQHFFCLATPGAGKSIMAAEVAKQLRERNDIDFILCFSPSKTVCLSLESTFSQYLGVQFDGLMGAVGRSVTYQNMAFFGDSFWQLFANFRVFVVFDEIHHCAGNSLENANSWGAEIITKIRDSAAFTLSLSGTPWRSNQTPIVLGRYIEPDFTLECDYVYGVRKAIEDKVCRQPTLVLMDNNEIRITDADSQTSRYGSLQEVLNETDCNYQSILHTPSALKQILKRANQTLNRIRCENVNAAGLVVASSIAHAELIQQQMSLIGETAELVTYRSPDAPKTIEAFKSNDVKWIISIGMISEGTDIPRLQVCCHLSRVKTELYFRQVLGRILRRNHTQNQEAWLYTFAEANLSKFAHRLEQEVPESNIVLKEQLWPSDDSEHFVESDQIQELSSPSNLLIPPPEFEMEDTFLGNSLNLDSYHQQIEPKLDFTGDFREKVVESYNSPF